MSSLQRMLSSCKTSLSTGAAYCPSKKFIDVAFFLRLYVSENLFQCFFYKVYVLHYILVVGLGVEHITLEVVPHEAVGGVVKHL